MSMTAFVPVPASVQSHPHLRALFIPCLAHIAEEKWGVIGIKFR